MATNIKPIKQFLFHFLIFFAVLNPQNHFHIYYKFSLNLDIFIIGEALKYIKMNKTNLGPTKCKNKQFFFLKN